MFKLYKINFYIWLVLFSALIGISFVANASWGNGASICMTEYDYTCRNPKTGQCVKLDRKFFSNCFHGGDDNFILEACGSEIPHHVNDLSQCETIIEAH